MYFFSPQPLIAHHPRHLTAAWAQKILDQHIIGKKVKSVNLDSVDVGTTTRIRLSVDHNATEVLPQKWFIKIPSLSWRAKIITALPRLLHTEVRFYRELSHSIAINKPDALSAKNFFISGSTLVLADLSEQEAIPGSTSDILSISQAHLVIEQLARLHAQFWNKAHNNPEYRWLADPVRQLEDHLGTALAVPLMKRGLNKAQSIVPSSLHAPAINYARNRRQTMRFLSQGTQTIVHHDCHPGNLFWHHSKPGLLDWQMVRIGEGISDISYFLATSLDSKSRRANENQLIEHYIKSLADQGIKQLDFKHIKQRYRAHLVYPFEAMLVTLAVGGMMDLEANHKLIARAASAVADNNAFSALSSKK